MGDGGVFGLFICLDATNAGDVCGALGVRFKRFYGRLLLARVASTLRLRSGTKFSAAALLIGRLADTSSSLICQSYQTFFFFFAFQCVDDFRCLLRSNVEAP